VPLVLPILSEPGQLERRGLVMGQPELGQLAQLGLRPGQLGQA